MYFLFLQFASSFSVLYLGNLCMRVCTELVHLFLLLCSLSLYDYSVVYFIPSLIYYPDKGNLGCFQWEFYFCNHDYICVQVYVCRNRVYYGMWIMGFWYIYLFSFARYFLIVLLPVAFKHSCFATIFLMLDIIQLLNLCQLCGCRMVSHCDFYLHFPIFLKWSPMCF